MLNKFLAPIVFAISINLFGAIAAAETPAAQLMNERLGTGQIALLKTELSQRIAQAPGDDEARFALGAVQFLMAIEHMSQSMYRHGLQQPRGFEQAFPFFRFPVPPNPSPEPLTYEKMRAVFQQAITDFTTAEATLAAVGSGEVKLPVTIGLIRLDLDGSGTAGEEETLWKVFNASLAGGNLPEPAARQFVIVFDRADVAWLRGYTHLLSAMSEFLLAHDWEDGFNASFQMFFPGAGLPGAALNKFDPPHQWGWESRNAADLIAFIHLAHWPVKEPQRMASVLSHLESVIALSRESWTYIQAETDDEAEWIPSATQKNGVVPGAPVTQARINGWLAFLDEAEAILKGKKLVPHWRLAQGINLRRVFTEPTNFDPILWAQGSAALPYLESGPMTARETWWTFMQLFEGNFLGYAVWFN